jgi:hypothetical protein
MAERGMPVAATNFLLESLAASKYLEITAKEEIKANIITSHFYTILKADWVKVNLSLINIPVNINSINKKQATIYIFNIIESIY